MSETITAPEYIGLVHLAADATKGDGEQIQHAFCTICYPVAKAGIPALCGATRPSSRPYRSLNNCTDPCVVCLDLAPNPCPVCGS